MKLCKSVSVTAHTGLLKIFSFVLIASFLLPALCFSAEVEPSDDIVQIVEDAFLVQKENMTETLLAAGFRSKKEMDNATIGEGFLHYKVSRDTILNDTSNNLYEMCTPINQWIFIVKTPERGVMILKVAMMDGKWTVFGGGASKLAKKLNEAVKAWPKSSGYSYRYFDIMNTSSHYLAVSEGKNLIGFIPMPAGTNVTNFNPRDLKTTMEIMPAVREWAASKLNVKLPVYKTGLPGK